MAAKVTGGRRWPGSASAVVAAVVLPLWRAVVLKVVLMVVLPVVGCRGRWPGHGQQFAKRGERLPLTRMTNS